MPTLFRGVRLSRAVFNKTNTFLVYLVVIQLLFIAIASLLSGTPDQPEIVRGKSLEACSCIIPCPCSFGQKPVPTSLCDSAAIFLFESGKIDAVSLKDLRFAIAERGGSQASLYFDPGLSNTHRKVLRKIANWILSLEGTPLTAELTAPITVQFESSSNFQCSVGTEIKITALPLRGNDGESPIFVSHPWIFGSFPIKSSQKYMAAELQVHAPGFSFAYKGTNANFASFEFSPEEIR